MTPETVATVSVEAFWSLAHRLPRSELVAGQVITLTPTGFRHGAIVGIFTRIIGDYVTRQGLGLILGAETGFILSRDPPTVRAPDISVVLKDRIPYPLPTGFFPGPPDLAVEVLSPDNRPGEIAAKLGDYLKAGSGAVWVVDPEAETITVRTRAAAVKYGRDEILDGSPVLPGFRIPLDALLIQLS